MLSIETETDVSLTALERFMAKVKSSISDPKPLYCIEPKIDGLAISLVYLNGKLTYAVTRGNGKVGEDVTANVMTIACIPKSLDLTKGTVRQERFEVRGEIYFPKSSFEAVNQDRLALGQKPFMNTRNAAAGSLRCIDPKETAKRPLKFLAYQVASKSVSHCQSNTLAILEDLGFPVPMFAVSSDAAELYNWKFEFGFMRNKLDYDIDGVVYKLNSFQDCDKLGYTSSTPRWAMAHKFPPQEMRTTLEAIEVQVGRSGCLTPVAVLKPVLVGGTMVSKATLHNVFDLRRRKVRVGDEVFVRRAGEVIPEVVAGATDLPRPMYRPNFKMPKTCPSCGGSVVRIKGIVTYTCVNVTSCPSQLKNTILHFASRSAMNIVGMGESTVEFLLREGLVKHIGDIYNLTLADLTPLGDKIAENLLSAIEDSKTTEPWRLLFGLGIPLVGSTTAKLVMSKVGDFERLSVTPKTVLLEIAGLGPTRAERIYSFFNHYDSSVTALHMAKLMRFTQPSSEQLSHPFYGGKVFVITGSFPTLGMSRDQIKAKLESLGATVAGAVSKTTDYLICGELPGASKLNKARQLEVPSAQRHPLNANPIRPLIGVVWARLA